MDSDIVVFDEPTASLDPLAELEQFNCIKKSFIGTSVILISHRIGMARMADRIIFIEHGRIIEGGSHEELLKLNGKYADFFHSQAKWY